MNVPFIFGARPSAAGSKTGIIVAFTVLLSMPVVVEAGEETSAGAFAASVFDRSVRRRVLPVPNGSIPYSAGRIAVTSNTAATAKATMVALTMTFVEGGSTAVRFSSINCLLIV